MEGPQELDKHIPKIQQHLDALLNACKAKEGWKETGTKKNIYIDHKAVEGGRFAMRGSGDMPGAKVDDIWNLILDFPNWKDWDKMVRTYLNILHLIS